MLSKEFRQYAEQCEKLARDCLDIFAREALIELAHEFRTEAELCERREGKKSTKTRH